MATFKNLRYCEVLYDGTYYDVMIGVDNLDEVNDILQEWAQTKIGAGTVLNLPEALIKNKDVTEVITSLSVDNFVYVQSAVSSYMDFPRFSGVSGTFPTLPKVLVSAEYVMPEATAFLYSLPGFTGVFGEYTVPTKSFTLIENEVNFIGIRYNAGTPEYALYADDSTYDYSSIIPVAKVLYFDGELNVIPTGQAGYGLPEKLFKIKNKRKDFDIITDFTLAASTNHVEISALTVSNEIDDIVCPIMDTETVDNDMWMWYKDGSSVWQKTQSDTINNTQYQGVGLQALGAGEFVINYIYRVIDDTNLLIFNVLSSNFATLAEAKDSDMITDLPDAIKEGAVLVGRMIVKQGSSSPTVQKLQRVNPFATV